MRDVWIESANALQAPQNTYCHILCEMCGLKVILRNTKNKN